MLLQSNVSRVLSIKTHMCVRIVIVYTVHTKCFISVCLSIIICSFLCVGASTIKYLFVIELHSMSTDCVYHITLIIIIVL